MPHTDRYMVITLLWACVSLCLCFIPGPGRPWWRCGPWSSGKPGRQRLYWGRHKEPHLWRNPTDDRTCWWRERWRGHYSSWAWCMWADVVSISVILTWIHSRCWGPPAEGSDAEAVPGRCVSRTTSCCRCGCPSACPRRCSHRFGAARAGSPGWQALWSSCAAFNWHNSYRPVERRWLSWYFTV